MIDKKQLTKLISYMSTFDGGLYIKKECRAKNASFIINMRSENLDYLLWVKETLENLTKVRLIERPDYNSDEYTRASQYRLESNSHPYLTTIRDKI